MVKNIKSYLFGHLWKYGKAKSVYKDLEIFLTDIVRHHEPNNPRNLEERIYRNTRRDGRSLKANRILAEYKGADGRIMCHL